MLRTIGILNSVSVLNLIILESVDSNMRLFQTWKDLIS